MRKPSIAAHHRCMPKHHFRAATTAVNSNFVGKNMEPVSASPQPNRICTNCFEFIVQYSHNSRKDLCKNCTPITVPQHEVDLHDIDEQMRQKHMQIRIITRERDRVFKLRLDIECKIRKHKVDQAKYYSQIIAGKISSLEKNIKRQIAIVQGLDEQLNVAYGEMIELRKQRETFLKKGTRKVRHDRSSTPKGASRKMDCDEPLIVPPMKFTKNKSSHGKFHT